MLRDLRVVFQMKSILLILAASITLRLFIFFFVLPSSPSRFGPDEGTYASLAKFVSRGTSVTDFPAYGAGLYNSARSIILPSVLFIKIGINELDAVRITSSIYGTASILFFSLIVVAYYDIKFKSVLIIKESFNRKTILLIGLFAFLPSNFIW